MDSNDRELHLRKVSTTAIVGPLDGIDDPVPSDSDFSPLSIGPEEARIEHVPLETVRGMWKKAKDLLTTPGAVVNGPRFSNSDPQTVVVASKSCTKPQSPGVLSCESTCPNWAAIRICSQTIAAAHFCSELGNFLAKYRKKNCSPNLTKLSKVGMPKRTGKKGDKPPRKRRCAETVHTFTPMPALGSSSKSPPSSHGGQNSASYSGHLDTADQEFPSYSGYLNSPFSRPQALHRNASTQCLHSMVILIHLCHSHRILEPNLNIWFPSSPCRPPQFRDQLNPHTLKFVCGNIRVCQSCRDSFRLADGSPRSPPLDLCVAHLGKRQYWNSTSNTWCVPSRETNSHYCARVVCIQFTFPTFILVVPEEVRAKLTDVHKDYLSREFSLHL